MRTPLITERLRNILLDGTRRQYSVEGRIGFVMQFAWQEPDLTVLRNAILETDAEFPWQDTNDYDGGPTKSINFLSDGDIKTDHWGGANDEKSVWFMLVPEWPSLSKGQVLAYEKYLTNLAQKIAGKRYCNIQAVNCVVTIRTSRGFKCQP